MLFEAVPNFSEGKNEATIAELCDALQRAGAIVVDRHLDADHHRSVLTTIGTAEQLEVGLPTAVAVAVERIDISSHEGVHPRVGAADVVPIVPLAAYADDGGSMDDAVALADRVAALVGGMGVPVVRYGTGTTTAFAGRARQGGVAGLTARLAAGELAVAAGPCEPHPTAGAVLVGARDVLIAFNIELDTPEVTVAKRIAESVREASGGLAGVRALGLVLDGPRVQLSTNIERWREVGPAAVFDAVCEQAAGEGVGILRCELVGLAPARALHDLHGRLDSAGVPLAAAAQPTIEFHVEVAGARVRAREGTL